MTLSTVIDDALAQLNVKMPAAIAAQSTDKTARLLLALANREARHQVAEHDWQALIVQNSFAALAQAAQTGALPTGFARLVNNTHIWNSTQRTRYAGPTTSNRWQADTISGATSVYGTWRIINGVLNLNPVPTAGDLITFESIDSRFANLAGGGTGARFVSGDDEYRLDELLLELGIIWRFGAGTKGFDYSEAMADWTRHRDTVASQDKGTPGIVVPQSSGQSGMPFLNWDGVIVE